MKKLLIVLTVVSMAALLFTGCLPDKNTEPIITYSASQTATEGTEFTSTVTATDAEGDTLIFSVSGGPSGMEIDSATGVISGWTPAAAGTETVLVTVSDGKLSSTLLVTITVTVIPIPEQDITIAVATEWLNTATGKTYVKGGVNVITVTFVKAVENPVVKVGTVVVPVFSLDNKVWHGDGLFNLDCDAVLITVEGVCEDLCAAKSVVVDSGNPYTKLKAKAIKCDCDEGYKLKVYSDWLEETDCEDLTGCCEDDCSGLASWNVKIYDENPWDKECCDPDPCIDPIAEADGTDCPVTITTDCIDEVYTPDEGWLDFFDGDYWVIATLTDEVGNEIKYFGWVSSMGMGDELGGELESFVELYIDPTSEDCWCPAEDPEAADLIIGDCDGTPTTECWEEPLNDCPEITVVPAEPVVGQPATITIDYTDAVKPTGKVSAYVGPAFKTLPLGVPEGSSELPLEEVEDFIYQADVVFGEAGDRIIYVVDACEDCPPCTYNITVLPADVCPVVEFLDNTFEIGGIPGYGFTNVDFTVTFANPIEKELVKVYVGIPGLAPIAMPIVMPPNALQVAMTTDANEQVYNGTIPIGDVRAVLVGVINHMTGAQPGDFGWVDPAQPWEALVALHPDLLYLLHTLGCIPLRIYVLAGDPCCIEVCEYPFILDPVGPFANLEVTFDTCEEWYCFEDDCTPEPYPGHILTISTETPGECTLEECCNDTCCGLAEWEAWIVPCYFYDPPLDPVDQIPQGPFDDCCVFDESLIPDACTYLFDPDDWYHWSGECPVEFDTDCVFDWADPFGLHPLVPDMGLNDIWNSVWYLYVKMTDCAENTTEYKARITFTAVPGPGPGDWVITMDTIVPLCDDAYDGVFGADFCVGPHF